MGGRLKKLDFKAAYAQHAEQAHNYQAAAAPVEVAPPTPVDHWADPATMQAAHFHAHYNKTLPTQPLYAAPSQFVSPVAPLFASSANHVTRL
jgi:hypothetical protein